MIVMQIAITMIIRIHLIHKVNHVEVVKKNNIKAKIIVRKLNKLKLKFKLY
jgi:hypothetical protein